MTSEPELDVCKSCDRPSATCTTMDSPSCQLAATLKDLEDCERCVRCDDHREIEIADDGGEESEHDPAECGCNVGRPCAGCKLVAERDLATADLKVMASAIKAMIERNGYCVVCEKYAPWHLITCIMGRY